MLRERLATEGKDQDHVENGFSYSFIKGGRYRSARQEICFLNTKAVNKFYEN